MKGSPRPGAASESVPLRVAVLADPVVVEGAVVLATVRTRASRDVVLQGGEVVLAASVAYKHLTGGIYGSTFTSVSRFTAEAAREALPAPTLLRAGEAVEQQVLLTVPSAGLPTVDCELVSIEWSVRTTVRFEGRGRVDAAPVALVVLSPGGPPPPVVRPDPTASVRIEDVHPRHVAEGTTVRGTVVLGGRRGAAGLRADRVELVLAQSVPHGPMIGTDPARSPFGPKEAETVVAESPLEAPEAGRADREVRVPFALAVPALPAPTLATTSFTLRWVLRAVVERRVAGFPRTHRSETEVVGSTIPGLPE